MKNLTVSTAMILTELLEKELTALVEAVSTEPTDWLGLYAIARETGLTVLSKTIKDTWISIDRNARTFFNETDEDAYLEHRVNFPDKHIVKDDVTKPISAVRELSDDEQPEPPVKKPEAEKQWALVTYEPLDAREMANNMFNAIAGITPTAEQVYESLQAAKKEAADSTAIPQSEADKRIKDAVSDFKANQEYIEKLKEKQAELKAVIHPRKKQA